jgi:hypothetical protein
VKLVSVTEVQDFLRCRRQWDLSSTNRQGLERIGPEAKHFAFGTAVHHALAAQVRSEKPLQALRDWWLSHVASPQADLVLDEEYIKVREVVRNYFDHYGWTQPLSPLRYLVEETTFRVQIPEMKDHFLVGTFDGVAIDDRTGRIWVVDHKTYTQKVDLQYLEMDWQFRAYCWALFQLTQVVPAGVVYDGIAKKVPTTPTRLANGELSRAMVDTTAQKYFETLVELGLNPDDYKDILNRLAAKEQGEQTQFFTRYRIRYVPQSLAAFEQHLRGIARDVFSPQLSLYPNFPWVGCWDCGVRDICRGMELGEDVEWLITNRYRRSEGHTTMLAQGKEPAIVGDIGDLVNVWEARREREIASGSSSK